MGPLFYYELVRLARRGRGTLLRCAYALSLLAALYFAYRLYFPDRDPWKESFTPTTTLPARELAGLAQSFVLVILRAQTVAVFVLTPVYLAGAITEERERGTLQLLFTTQLNNREIVLGKLTARLTHLGGILLAGLPLLAATQLWGGVDLSLLAAAFAVTALNLLCVGAMSVLISVLTTGTWSATTESFAASAVLFLLSLMFPGATPMGIFALLNEFGEKLWTIQGWPFALFGPGCHAALALAFGTRAVVLLRTVESVREGGPTVAEPAAGVERRRDVPLPPSAGRELPPFVVDHPLLWKETSRGGWTDHTREFEYGLRTEWRYALAAVVCILGCIVVLAYAPEVRPQLEAFGATMRVTGVLAAGAWCVGTAFRAVGSVSLERDRRTLDGLLTLPCSRETVLGAKWLGSVLRGRTMGYWLGFFALVGLLVGALHPVALFLVAVAVAVHLSLWASLGLWLSVFCRTTLRARVSVALVLLVFAVGLTGFLIWTQVGPLGDYDYDLLPADFWGVAVNPVLTWWFLAFGWRSGQGPGKLGSGSFGEFLAVAALGTLAYALAAGLLWLDACRRFRKGVPG